MTCKICGGECRQRFSAMVRSKYRVTYFSCDTCGFLQTEDPFWLPESYAESINASDTGIVARNIQLSRIASSVIWAFFDKDATFLDYAGGYGIYTRLMRDIGFDYYWHDPYTKNIFAKGFEFRESARPLELITCFEAFEHLRDPVAEVRKMLDLSPNILFSTHLVPQPPPEPSCWWYYGLEHGQHISFYAPETLARIAGTFGLNCYSDDRSIHLFTRKNIRPKVFRFILRASGFGFGSFVKLVLKSRTEADSKRIVESGNPGEAVRIPISPPGNRHDR